MHGKSRACRSIAESGRSRFEERGILAAIFHCAPGGGNDLQWRGIWLTTKSNRGSFAYGCKLLPLSEFESFGVGGGKCRFLECHARRVGLRHYHDLWKVTSQPFRQDFHCLVLISQQVSRAARDSELASQRGCGSGTPICRDFLDCHARRVGFSALSRSLEGNFAAISSGFSLPGFNLPAS